MPFDRRDPLHQHLVSNGRRVEDPKVPRGVYPFMVGLGIRPPMESDADRPSPLSGEERRRSSPIRAGRRQPFGIIRLQPLQ